MASTKAPIYLSIGANMGMPLRRDHAWRHRDRVSSCAFLFFKTFFTKQYYTAPYCASLLYSTILYHTILHYTLLEYQRALTFGPSTEPYYNATILCQSKLFITVLYASALYYDVEQDLSWRHRAAVLHYSIQNFSLDCTALRCTLPYAATLYDTIQYYYSTKHELFTKQN